MAIVKGTRRTAGGTKFLTLRQLQVIAGLLAGLGAKEIGGLLNISTRCVKYHAEQVYRRYGVDGRTGLLSKFGRFEIDVRWVATRRAAAAPGAPAHAMMPGSPLPRPPAGPGGIR